MLIAQKISTEGKAKIQLQVVLHDDTSSTFHFISPSGQQQQLKDRGIFNDWIFYYIFIINNKIILISDQVKDQLGKKIKQNRS